MPAHSSTAVTVTVSKLWRKAAKPELEQRGTDVEQLYRAQDCPLAAQLIDRYRIGWIVLGDHERERLPGLEDARLLRLAAPVARFGGTRLLQPLPAGQRCTAQAP